MLDLTEEQEDLLAHMAARRQRRPFDTVVIGTLFSPLVGALYIRDWVYVPFALLSFVALYGAITLLGADDGASRGIAVGLFAFYCATIAGLVPRTKWQNGRIEDDLRERLQVEKLMR